MKLTLKQAGKRWNAMCNSPTGIVILGLMGVALMLLLMLDNPWSGALTYLFAIFYIAWSLKCVRKASLCVVLSLSLLTPEPAKAQEPQPIGDSVDSVGVAIGVVVICVGAVCTYKVVKFCQKAFPKDKKDGSNTNEFTGLIRASADGDAGEYGASWNYGSPGSCSGYEGDLTAASDDASGTQFNLNVLVQSGGAVRTTMSVSTGAGATLTFAEFQADVISHGLYISGNRDGASYFSRDGIPCTAYEVPLFFDEDTKSVRHDLGGTLRHLIVERSKDLAAWTKFLETDVSEGTGFVVSDATREGQMFYRVQVTQP